jgi:hypothetical protein
MKRWSAILPLAMSVVGLALIFGHVATSGGVRETDKGTAAHLWQLLMAVQLPIVAFFAIAWLPRAPVKGVLPSAFSTSSVSEVHGAPTARDLRLRHEFQRDRVHAMPRVLCGKPLADEHMAEVSAAGGALYFDAIAIRIR